MEFASAPGLPDLPGVRITGLAFIDLTGEWNQGKSNLIVKLVHMVLRSMHSGPRPQQPSWGISLKRSLKNKQAESS